jgi:hypothetical protein
VFSFINFTFAVIIFPVIIGSFNGVPHRVIKFLVLRIIIIRVFVVHSVLFILVLLNMNLSISYTSSAMNRGFSSFCTTSFFISKFITIILDSIAYPVC